MGDKNLGPGTSTNLAMSATPKPRKVVAFALPPPPPSSPSSKCYRYFSAI